jgi:ZIP family zinc transporter
VNPAWAALGWGLAAGAALPLGAAAGCWLELPQRAVAAVMAFGSGTLIAALSLVQGTERDARDIAAYLSTLK